MRAGDEILWDVDEHATLFIEPDTALAGAGRITFAVAELDALLRASLPAASTTADRATRTASAT